MKLKAILVGLAIVVSVNTAAITYLTWRVTSLETVAIPVVEEDPAVKQSKLRTKYINVVVKRYKKDEQFVTRVVDLAFQYQKKDFPQASDIVSIVGIESSWDTKAKSKLRRDPALGLTQIRPGAWKHKFKKHELKDVDNQIKYAVDILHHYYKVSGNREDAIVAYNIGLKARLSGRDNPQYLEKYSQEKLNFI